MPVIAIYVRVSTPRQAQSQSTEQQLERLRAYVLAQNWDLERCGLARNQKI